MFKCFKIKLYPTKNQIEMLENHFNGYRYCYNLALEYRNMMWNDYKINKSGIDLQKELFEVRKSSHWLIKCKAECIRDAGLKVDKAVKGFFKGKGYPKFKSKKNIQSFAAYQSIVIKKNKITFYKNKIAIKTSDEYIALLENNKIKRVTFKKDKCGDYWAICLLELINDKKLPDSDKIIGIDLGIKHLAITSDGIFYENPKFLINTYYKLLKQQRKFSKTENLQKTIIPLFRN